MSIRPLLAWASLFLAPPAFANPPPEVSQQAEAVGATDGKARWDVQNPPGEHRLIRFEIDEGTWMNLDVSPDGREIVFDLLGNLYRLPIEGGRAEALTQGFAFDIQPRYSPDGRWISFTSDRGGGDNIWLLPREGGDPVQVTDESFRLLNNAVWLPDGDYLVARKHFTGTRSLGAGELWLYHRSGGQGLQLTQRKNDQQDAGEPAVSPCGRYVYFSEDVSPGPTFQYNKDPHGLIYAIRRLDRESGELIDLVRVQGGAVRPQPSPDGRWLAFVRRVRSNSVLTLMDLDSGALHPLFDGLSRDQQEAWAIFGVYPNYAWTPDSKRIVVWAQGKLWSVGLDGQPPTQIPFVAEVAQPVLEAIRREVAITETPFQPLALRDLTTSPDGRTLVFHAVGSLWLQRLPDGRAERLSRDDDVFEYMPAFSPDGRSLAYVTWNDERLAEVRIIDLRSRRSRVLSPEPGYYADPRYAPDGRHLVYQRQGGAGLLGSAHGLRPGLYEVPVGGGPARLISREGRQPWYSADGSRVYFLTGSGLSKTLASVDRSGGERREHFSLKYPSQVIPSPDGRYVAFRELYNVYVAPMVDTGRAVELSKDSRAIPVTRLSSDVGDNLHWSADGQRLHWTQGNRYFSRTLRESFAFLPGAPQTLPAPTDDPGLAIRLEVPVDRPDGLLALVGARLITMRGDEVIEDGVLLLDGPRIRAVGSRDEVRIPDGARRIEVAGKTVMPGIVDVHAHAAHFHSGPSPQQNWAYYANLAYGVTTMHDPSANTDFVFAQSELVRAGRIVGPRVFSTGTILYGADGDFRVHVDSLDDARSHLRRLRDAGAFSVKSYNQPRRDQRQQIKQAARELGMLVVMEGGSTFFHNINMVIDGATGVEHNLPIAPLYEDVIRLWAGTQVGNTLTLTVAYGGPSGEYWWYENDDVWRNERLLRFTPREVVDARAIRRQKAPFEDYYHITVAESAKKLSDAGVRILLGSHGQVQGLAAHWELWMLGQGGFAPMQALRAATLHGAEYLGLHRDLGSLEPGKLADLIVLDANPLEDLRHSERIHMVMVNGRLFDGATMAEIGGRQRPAPTFFWQREGHAPGALHALGHGELQQCSCPKGQSFAAWLRRAAP